MISTRLGTWVDKYYGFCVVFICSFWFCSLYPGRVGADYSALLSMIWSGDSTDWWTGSFYWFLRATSLDGNFLAITSVTQLSIFYFSIVWFVNSLPGSVTIKRIVILIFLSSPIFGFFGMTISHDLTQTAGIIILCGLEIRALRRTPVKKEILVYLFAIALVLTTHSGLLIAIVVLCLNLLKKKFKRAFFILLMIFVVGFAANLGLTKGLDVYGNFLKTSWVKYWPSLNVIKCVAQHPEAEISQIEWQTLTKLAPKEVWVDPVSCSDYDITTLAVGHENIIENSHILSSAEYLKTYLSVFSKNPAIGVMAHIQRARGALPPILFQPPENQVNLDVDTPIGKGTNTALQSGPELLHPSIDIPGGEDGKPRVFSILEFPAQGSAFIFNQASWFWGWGGLWISVALFILIRIFREYNPIRVIMSMYPALLVHSIYFYFIPSSLPRYYMFSICIGVVLSVYVLAHLTFRETKDTATRSKA